MLTRLFASLCVFTTLTSAPVTAQDSATGPSPVVVELFTSQGCSSCPPADAVLAELAQDPNVIPLALHVDYWDYLGWKDKFAQHKFTRRQKSYARHAGRKMIFTPEVVVNGHAHLVGSHAEELAQTIRAASGDEHPVLMTLSRDGESVQIDLEPSDPSKDMPAGVVQIVTFIPSETVDVKRGENAGQSILYTNIVQDWVALDPINEGVPEVRVTFDLASDLPFAVLYQAPEFGPVLAAAALR